MNRYQPPSFLGKESPIVFSTDMVKAILSGKKTQTRRIVKPQPHNVPEGAYASPYNNDYKYFTIWTKDNRMCLGCGGNIKDAAHWSCPYGIPNTRSWVRETFHLATHADTGEGYCYCYKADDGWAEDEFKWTPSIYLPRDGARILINKKDIRMERLQNITEEDAKAEGVDIEWLAKWADKYAEIPKYNRHWISKHAGGNKGIIPTQELVDSLHSDLWESGIHKSDAYFISGAISAGVLDYEDLHQMCYRLLWDSMHGKKAGCSWRDNPWVWVVDFERI